MITAIDTNILLDILVPSEKFCDASVQALENAAMRCASSSRRSVSAIPFAPIAGRAARAREFWRTS
jgi:hypothetical protein